MVNDTRVFDIAVIGAGIAGASVAAELATDARVALIEMESQPGYHATGRSAAVYAPSYGPAPIRALTRASEAFFLAPPAGACDGPLLQPAPTLFVARPDQMAALAALAAELGPEATVPLELLDGAAVEAVQPLLRKGHAAGGLIDRGCSNIDVAALHQGYLRRFRALGGVLMTDAEVTGMTRTGGAWRLDSRAGPLAAAIVVNAAGAWADVVGRMAGAGTVGLMPRRRTALTIPAPAGQDISGLPLTVDAGESFYLKPDAGRLLISPANEDPEPPGDVQPDEIDIAICIDRIETAFDLRVRRIESRWAGLRSFVADKAPVAGYSGLVDGFFWLAGQGGYGIQSAPGLSRLAAALVRGDPIPADILAQGFHPDSVTPARCERAPDRPEPR